MNPESGGRTIARDSDLLFRLLCLQHWDRTIARCGCRQVHSGENIIMFIIKGIFKKMRLCDES